MIPVKHLYAAGPRSVLKLIIRCHCWSACVAHWYRFRVHWCWRSWGRIPPKNAMIPCLLQAPEWALCILCQLEWALRRARNSRTQYIYPLSRKYLKVTKEEDINHTATGQSEWLCATLTKSWIEGWMKVCCLVFQMLFYVKLAAGGTVKLKYLTDGYFVHLQTDQESSTYSEPAI